MESRQKELEETMFNDGEIDEEIEIEDIPLDESSKTSTDSLTIKKQDALEQPKETRAQSFKRHMQSFFSKVKSGCLSCVCAPCQCKESKDSCVKHPQRGVTR